jgi:hypothetical protein
MPIFPSQKKAQANAFHFAVRKPGKKVIRQAALSCSAPPLIAAVDRIPPSGCRFEFRRNDDVHGPFRLSSGRPIPLPNTSCVSRIACDNVKPTSKKYEGS